MFPCLQDKEPLGIIPLENLSVRKVDDPKKPVSLHCLVLCQSRLLGGQWEERVHTLGKAEVAGGTLWLWGGG